MSGWIAPPRELSCTWHSATRLIFIGVNVFLGVTGKSSTYGTGYKKKEICNVSKQNLIPLPFQFILIVLAKLQKLNF